MRLVEQFFDLEASESDKDTSQEEEDSDINQFEDDKDENGNLKGFVTDDKDSDSPSETEIEEEKSESSSTESSDEWEASEDDKPTLWDLDIDSSSDADTKGNLLDFVISDSDTDKDSKRRNKKKPRRRKLVRKYQQAQRKPAEGHTTAKEKMTSRLRGRIVDYDEMDKDINEEDFEEDELQEMLLEATYRARSQMATQETHIANQGPREAVKDNNVEKDQNEHQSEGDLGEQAEDAWEDVKNEGLADDFGESDEDEMDGDGGSNVTSLATAPRMFPFLTEEQEIQVLSHMIEARKGNISSTAGSLSPERTRQSTHPQIAESNDTESTLHQSTPPRIPTPRASVARQFRVSKNDANRKTLQPKQQQRQKTTTDQRKTAKQAVPNKISSVAGPALSNEDRIARARQVVEERAAEVSESCVIVRKIELLTHDLV